MAAAPGRARQLAAGARATEADAILFLHADTPLSAGLGRRRALGARRPGRGGRRLRVPVRGAGPRAPARGVGRARAARARGPARTAIRRCSRGAARSTRSAACPQAPIMEDLDLVRALRRRGRLALLRAAGHHLGAALPRARRVADGGEEHAGAARLGARPRPRPPRRLVPAMTAARRRPGQHRGDRREPAQDVPAALALHAPPQARLRGRARHDADLRRSSSCCSRWPRAGAVQAVAEGLPGGGDPHPLRLAARARRWRARACASSRACSSSTPRARSSTSCATTCSRTCSASPSPSSSAGAPAT